MTIKFCCPYDGISKVQRGETITAVVYRCQLNDVLLQKRQTIAANSCKVIPLHDNARPDVARVIKDTMSQLEEEFLPHPAYSPDKAPSDNQQLLRTTQHDVAGSRLQNAEKVRKSVDNLWAVKPIQFSWHGIAVLPESWGKVYIYQYFTNFY